jgi:microcystin degradation protein MlrC
MFEARLTNAAFGTICDPAAVAAATTAGVGATVRLEIGGKRDAKFSGRPIVAEATVLMLSDGRFVHEGPYAPGTPGSFGPSAKVAIGGIAVILATHPVNILDQQQFKVFGIQPPALSALGLKCMHGFRAAFEPSAGRVLACDAGGVCTYDYAKLDYRQLRRPIWPLDTP